MCDIFISVEVQAYLSDTAVGFQTTASKAKVEKSKPLEFSGFAVHV